MEWAVSCTESVVDVFFGFSHENINIIIFVKNCVCFRFHYSVFVNEWVGGPCNIPSGWL